MIGLLVMIAVFTALSTVAGVAAYQDLSHRLGGGNLGIFMQALSSSSHGAIPFYESPDCTAKERCSFLLVHPGFVLAPMVPLYGAAPSATTLFLIQSLGVGLAALPLYWLTRQVTNSPGKGLVAAGLYLVWAPLLAGEAFSFGLESFLPLALFSVAALWQAREYLFGFVAAALAFCTFEITPIFVALIAVFFLYPAAHEAAGRAWQGVRDWSKGSIPLGRAARAWAASLRGILARTEVRASVALLLASGLAFLALQWFMNVGGAQLIGAPTPGIHYGWSSLFYDNSGSQQNGVALSTVLHSPKLILTSPQTVTTLEYWGVLFGLVAFIPFLAPRTMIIILPWVGFTFLSLSFRFDTIGLAADSISAVPVFIGVAYGLRRFDLGWMNPAEGARAAAKAPPRGARPAARPPGGVTRASAGLCWSLLGAAVLANLLLSSIAPPALGGVSGRGPFRGDYFFAPVAQDGGIAAVESLVGSLPPDTFVGVPTELFPLVANDPNAFIVSPYVAIGHLPFNTTGGPAALLVDGFGGYLPAAMARSIGNPRLYGVSGFVSSTALGPVLLYQRGFSGEPNEFGSPVSPVSQQFTDRSGLDNSSDGSVSSFASAPGGSAIVSHPGLRRGGAVGHTGDFFLYPVNYSVELYVEVNDVNGTSGPKTTALQVAIQAFADYTATYNISVSSLAIGHWSTIAFSFNSDVPYLWANVVVRLLDVRYSVALGQISMAPTSS